MLIAYRANTDYLRSTFASNPHVVLIVSMNTRRDAARRLVKEVANAGARSHDEKVPPLEKNSNIDQSLSNLPPMTELEMMAIHAQISQAMTTQAQVMTVQG